MYLISEIKCNNNAILTDMIVSSQNINTYLINKQLSIVIQNMLFNHVTHSIIPSRWITKINKKYIIISS